MDNSFTDAGSRVCRSCRNAKPVSAFGVANQRKDRLNVSCRACVAEAAKVRRSSNPEREKLNSKLRYQKNRESFIQMGKDYYWRNREKILAKNRLETRLNPQKRRAYLAERRKDPVFRLNKRMSGAIQRHLRSGEKGGRTWERLVGYSLSDLRTHLDGLFSPGMTWENFGEWHIDHIIPLSAHNYDSFENPDFRRAWALSNLRPLWAADNLRKGATLSAPFQPSLALRFPIAS